MKKNGAVNLFFLVLIAILGVGIASVKGALKPNVLGWTSLLVDRGSADSDSVGSSGGEERSGGRPTTTGTNPVLRAQQLKQQETEKRNVTTATEFFDFQRKEEKTSLRVTRFGSLIEFKTEDHEASPEAENQNTENENQNDDKALHDVNEALKPEDVEVSTSTSGLVVRHGETEAETHFPLSVNTTTHELTVTTPAGTKTVTVLPDTAVNNLLNQGVLKNVETQPATAGAVPINKVTIVEFNNQPAFEVHGSVEKKLFGIIPFGQGKKVFVSTQTGGVLFQSEDLLGQLLGFFSF